MTDAREHDAEMLQAEYEILEAINARLLGALRAWMTEANTYGRGQIGYACLGCDRTALNGQPINHLSNCRVGIGEEALNIAAANA